MSLEVASDAVSRVTDIESAIISIRVPIQKLNVGKQLLIVPTSRSDTTIKRAPNTKLVRALARGHYYQKLLDSGKYANIRALTKKYGASTYESLQLNLLSPAIRKVILDGIQPRTVSLVMLKKPFSDVWTEQLTHFCSNY